MKFVMGYHLVVVEQFFMQFKEVYQEAIQYMTSTTRIGIVSLVQLVEQTVQVPSGGHHCCHTCTALASSLTGI